MSGDVSERRKGTNRTTSRLQEADGRKLLASDGQGVFRKTMAHNVIQYRLKATGPRYRIDLRSVRSFVTTLGVRLQMAAVSEGGV